MEVPYPRNKTSDDIAVTDPVINRTFIINLNIPKRFVEIYCQDMNIGVTGRMSRDFSLFVLFQYKSDLDLNKIKNLEPYNLMKFRTISFIGIVH